MAGLILSAALAASGWAAAPKGDAAPPRLALEVKVEPAVARPGQPVALRVRWTNRGAAGGRQLRVNRRCLLGREVSISVKPRGKPALALQTPPDLGPPLAGDFQALGPREYFEYEYPVRLRSGDVLSPGAYEVLVSYRNSAAPPGDVPPWTGALQAGAAFRVVPFK